MSLSRENQEKKFETEYARLNPEQQKAVDSLEGPVMVIAGPGTGKTQILASRIGKILLDTDTQPEHILCLTYTDAGVVAMRKRLQQLIGAAAYRVTIGTFHSFCNDVIQDNLVYFEKSSLDPISDLERIQLLKELVDGFPKQHPLKRYRGDVYFEIKGLQELFSTMKRENWTPDFLFERIDAYVASLPERDEYIAKRSGKYHKKGELLTEKLTLEQEKMLRLRAAVGEFEPFQQLMQKRNRYDFDDMINWVLAAFASHSTLLATYQERYTYLLVDEYQDSSGSQNKLVEMLADYWTEPNLFVVGDDDQSIYRFQGANIDNMTGLADRYRSSLKTVLLTQNYRSNQPILQTAGSLIDRNSERLVHHLPGLSKSLKAALPQRLSQTHLPICREYENPREEMIGIVLEIERCMAAGVPASSIAVLYKEHKYGEELARYLQLRAIPVYSKKSLDLLQLSLVKKIVLLLDYLASEHDVPTSGDEMLFELLHYDWFGIAPLEITKLALAVASRRNNDLQASLRVALQEKMNAAPVHLFSATEQTPLEKTGQLLERLIGAVPNLTLQQLIQTLIQETGLLSYYMRGPQKHEDLKVLTAFFDFVKEETRRRPDLDLEGLVTLIALMKKENISLPFVQISGGDKGVNLLTAHGSKGLEFNYVFLAGCQASTWEKKRKPSSGYSFPDNLTGFSTGSSSIEELRRLFYVALTRAEEHLFISYSRTTMAGKPLEPSQFVMEIIEQQPLSIEKVSIDRDTRETFELLELSSNAVPVIASLEDDITGPLIEKFVMNVTALNNYLKCPLEFYYRTLIKIPSPKNEATEFGSAVHHALEKLFRNMQDSGKERFPDKSFFLHEFDLYMRRHRESFTREQFARRLEYGHQLLETYYDRRIHSFTTIVAVERNIRNIVYQGVPLKGKLDKLEFDGKSVNVVDYKTGDPDKALAKLKGPDAKQPLGGDYWRQAVFYKILVDQFEGRGWTAVSTEFDFVEPDKKKQYRQEKIVITPEDLQQVGDQIKQVWERIQARDFYTGCGKPDCHWCNFVKTNQLAVSLLSPDEEEDNADL
jgi:DNA helicase II / ATP-dependent DNA helicase PcrA